MTENTFQCDADLLRRYLTGELSANDEAGVVQHLDGCPHCQQAIESLAASAAEWDDVRRLLTPDVSALLAVLPSAVANPGLRVGDASATDLEASGSIESRLEFLAPTDDPEMLGRLGPYEIKGLVGQGGMGLVLKAYDRALQRTVAIKVLSPHLATNPTARRRFAREAQAAAAVAHEHVIAIHAVAEAGGLPYLVMPYMPGQSLQQRLDEAGPLSPVEVLRIGSQIAAGLAAAHAQGLVHRDIKPANILLEQGIERVAITDFGLARAIDDASLTRTGVLAGTPAYMSPEQARGDTVDHRADLFSLGSVMYAMCAGRPPFRAESTVAVLKRICEEEPTPLCELNADVPPWLARIVGRLHAKAPAERFADAAEVAELLQQCLAHLQNPMAVALPIDLQEPTRRRRANLRSISGIIAAGCLLFAVVASVVWNRMYSSTSNGQEGAKQTTASSTTDEDPKPTTTHASNAKPSIPDEQYKWLEAAFAKGNIEDPETLYQWSVRMLRIEATQDSSVQRGAIEKHRERMQRLEQLVESNGSTYKEAAAYYRVEAEKMVEDGWVEVADEW